MTRHIHVLIPRWIERLFWTPILAISNCVIRVLDAWGPEFSHVAPPIPSDDDGYYTDFDG
jgi:hypothetical protein